MTVSLSGKNLFLLHIKRVEQIHPGGNFSVSNDLYKKNPSQIVMYSTEYCPDCHRAKKFFETNGIEYLKVGLENNEEATLFVMDINDGNRSVPTIIFPDGSVLVEPSWEELRIKTAIPTETL